MKTQFLLVAILFFAFSCTSHKYGTITTVGDHSFDFDWKFQLGDPENAVASDFDDSQWRALDVPHDWSIEGELDAENPVGNDGGYFPAGIGWYRKSFQLSEDLEGAQISIYFEGVYMNAEVFINGQTLGVHPYGYTSFSHNLTPYLKFGEENILAVKVDNSIQKNCRWYSGSGIYRHVKLIVNNPVFIDQWGVNITTPEVDPSIARVLIDTKVNNESTEGGMFTLRGKLVDANNYLVSSNKVLSLPGENTEISTEFYVSLPQLWSPESPNLYQVELTLIDEKDNLIDQQIVPFGIRSIEFSAEEGFKLNGEKVLLNGGCVHHDNGALGAKAYDRAEERKVELLKAAGFNAVRTSHNPPSEAFLDACDRLGLLVIDEAFDGWRTAKAPQADKDYSLHFDQWAKKDVQSMVKRDFNHPSIIMWSIGNEIIERTSPEAVETAKMLSTAVKEIDTTRPVTSAMTTWGQGWEIFDPLMSVHDVCGYNYQMHRAEKDHERVPERIMVHTESYPRDAFAMWQTSRENSYVLGDFVWTAMDYLGESGIGRYYYSPDEPDGEHWHQDWFPWHGAYCGDIDLTGWRKPISHYRSMLWNENGERLYMAVKEPNPDSSEIKTTSWAVDPTWESWTWPGYEGKTLEVVVYSKYSVVRLYLNDELIGEKPTGYDQEYMAVFDVPYQPGELRAFGMERDQEVEMKKLKSAGTTAKINLQADRSVIRADGQDLSFVAVEVRDTAGILQTQAQHRITFAIDGPGTIVGVDNANLQDLDAYVSNTRKVWNGRALVIVKSDRIPGDILLTATAPGLEQNQITISSHK